MRHQALTVVFCTFLRFLGPALAYPAKDYAVSAKPQESDSPAVEFYLAADAATHQTYYNEFSAKGYRMASLSSFGIPPNEQYAAAWVKRSGPSFTAIHNANASVFQAWIKEYSTTHVPTLIAATGPADSAVFSGVMETGNITWTQKCDMTEYDFGGNDQGARAQRQILRSFRQYGTAGDYRYCAVWHTNPDYDKWNSYTSNTASNKFQAVVDTEKSKPYWRPGSVSIAEDGSYTSFWTDTSIGDWTLRYDLTASELEAEITKQKTTGNYPIQIAGGGSGQSTRYAAIFAQQDVPSERSWKVTGPSTSGFPDSPSAELKAEGIIQNFMQKAGVRQVQLAIARNGRTWLNKAFTWSEPERPVTQTNDTFLLASNSKAFVAACIQSLFDAEKLTPDTKAYTFLNYSTAPFDPRSEAITVQHLLDHTAGFKRSISGDPAYQMRDIALAQSSGARPASLADVIDYMYHSRALDYAPGADYEYGNYAYMLLSAVVERAAGQPYWEYLRATVVQPEGLDVRAWATDASAHAADNVVQESADVGLSALAPRTQSPVAHVYGGDGQVKEGTLGATGLAASAGALVSFIHKHAAYGVGGRTSSYRDGTTSGARTYMESRWDGVDWALTVNTRDFPNGDGDFNDVTGAVNGWLDGLDLGFA